MRIFIALTVWTLVSTSVYAQDIASYQSSSIEIYSLDSVQNPDHNHLSSTTIDPVNEYVASAASGNPSVEIYSLSPDSNSNINTPTSSNSDEAPVDLEANSLKYDETGRRVTATGDVVLRQSGRILTADEITYTADNDTAVASGDVVLRDQNGDILYADQAQLARTLEDGEITNLRGDMNDGSHFWASRARRIGGSKTLLDDARYTACDLCKENPDKAPIWQIKADEVTHDKQDAKYVYRNAQFEVAGIPVLYTPYLSHSDGTIKRKSGFLSPSAGFQSDTGFFVENSYYQDIAPNKDATVGLRVMTRAAPLVLGEYRQRWRNAGITIGGGVTYSSRPDSDNSIQGKQEEETRGHIIGDALWDMNDKWRSGAQINLASDDQYLRQYNFDNSNNLDSNVNDVLVNEIYTERFSSRNYSTARAITFQDVRVDERRQDDQPQILPEVIASFIGDPSGVPIIGGRWDVEGSLLGLHREGNNQDQTRASLKLGWKRHFIEPYTGIKGLVRAQTRGDVYYLNDTQTLANNEDDTQTRLYSALHAEVGYPLAKPTRKGQLTVEPRVAFTLTPTVGQNSDITNEDSQDVQISAANLFNINRFPGFDRVEDSSRLTYGINTGYYGDNGNRLTGFIGQSYRTDTNDDLFPAGSGIDEKSSDFVGHFQTVWDDKHRFWYDMQLDNETFASRRHEVSGATTLGGLNLNARYLFATRLQGTDIQDDREQLRVAAQYSFTPEWSIRSGATQDFGEDEGLRRAFAGVDYTGQCFSWSLTGRRNYTDDLSGDSDTQLFLRIGLKNLGEFETSGVSLMSSE